MIGSGFHPYPFINVAAGGVVDGVPEASAACGVGVDQQDGLGAWAKRHGSVEVVGGQEVLPPHEVVSEFVVELVVIGV